MDKEEMDQLKEDIRILSIAALTPETRIEYGPVPGRKSKAICVTAGSVCWPVAYFRDEESYERFCDAVRGRTMRWEETEHEHVTNVLGVET